jgi:hypothetical protein
VASDGVGVAVGIAVGFTTGTVARGDVTSRSSLGTSAPCSLPPPAASENQTIIFQFSSAWTNESSRLVLSLIFSSIWMLISKQNKQ